MCICSGLGGTHGLGWSVGTLDGYGGEALSLS